MAHPAVLILIVTWNRRDLVMRLLDNLARHAYPVHRRQILVVDNASADGTAAAIARAYPNAAVVRNPENLGGSGGFNTGLKWAFAHGEGHHRYIWLLDNDVLPHRHALSELVALLESTPAYGAAGSTMMCMEAPHQVHEVGGFLDRRRGLLRLNRHRTVFPHWRGQTVQNLINSPIPAWGPSRAGSSPCEPVEYAAATSLLVRWEAARHAGLWRDYFIHFDDVEWGLRLKRSGHPTAGSLRSFVWHDFSSRKQKAQMRYYDCRNLLDLLRVHGGGRHEIRGVRTRILLKGLYYALSGRPHIGAAHRHAVEDFRQHRLGRRDLVVRPDARLPARISDITKEVVRISALQRKLLLDDALFQAGSQRFPAAAGEKKDHTSL